MITKEDVEHIGWLARIEINEQETVEYMEKLNSVLEYFGQLDEVQTEDVAPTYHVAEVYNVFREDVAEECLPQETVLANTEHKQDGTFRVPKIG
ncbi:MULTISPECIES: Asp-tRNA(Asn)/Glu-tRNA(Gln) amidotransferase subunit GatC [Methanosarcina]|jgi:aspartyl-tRNA(Asn)/glutamyl-tRNA(Gln) amidotransferase subunit C|uniref:Aspartyl/glutamyl-tRNA(Asn/Gln) amidotransferase subunit C n=1 Tax=Methanosarcina mazei TaxID=2209 RepID=A0A0F8S8V4_METMZ|nr:MULTISPECIES: Asp-tRNA(Asn)/Glu-tRNA(Gln) amidotransferase subunit GatC [Methanosarcina]KKG02897.1 glutamyl-tRNA amidotransferase [Methanosarcina mazei]KKG09149.1 glutamyl-tRNA amidotransferase [Methanosarcina mazei]KKG56716.1 glutamyl-tRNA amidotransferase [Methanosarcina mazei]KKG61662.1 glutamyl-tRNA amidotransferase [Methanosarcina mazei]KKG64432.1 glutamyl-tRNA amidotransferase [Methanosarcina mazei]